MKWLILLIALTSQAYSQAWKSHHLIAGCTIFSMTGEKLKSFPGQLCLFLDDGSFISADDHGIRRISKESSKLWEISGHYHHQLNLTADKTRILAMSSALADDKRQDKFQVIDLAGKILFENTAEKLIELGFFPKIVLDHARMNLDGKTIDKEISHFNSFHEVPKLSTKKKFPDWLKEGYFVLNGLEQGVIIVTPDLKEVTLTTWFKNSVIHKVHDVQVTERGTFLYFNNLINLGPEIKKPLGGGNKLEERASGIFEMEPITKDIKAKFIANPPGLFYSWISGGVQELDEDTWLFTHFLTGTYIYSKKTKSLISNIVSTHADYAVYNPVQQVNSRDLSKFLEHWK